MSKKLKDYNATLVSMTIFNLVILIGDLLFSFIKDFNSLSKDLLAENYVFLCVIPIVTYILNGLLPPNFKAVIVYMRTKNPLPGTRVFTELIQKDERIDINRFNMKYSGYSTVPEEQNKMWYQIYSNHKYDPVIYESHRDFLKSRDMTSLAFLLLILFAIYAFMGNLIYTYLAKMVYLVLQYILLAIVSQNKGNRFVLNVVASDLNMSKGEV